MTFKPWYSVVYKVSKRPSPRTRVELTQETTHKVFRRQLCNRFGDRIDLRVDPFLDEDSSKSNNRLKTRNTDILTPGSKITDSLGSPVSIKGRCTWKCIRQRCTLKQRSSNLPELKPDDRQYVYTGKYMKSIRFDIYLDLSVYLIGLVPSQ